MDAQQELEIRRQLQAAIQAGDQLAELEARRALQGPPPKEGTGARLNREIEAVKRTPGLAARAVIQGATKAAGVFSDPFAYILSVAGLPVGTAGYAGTKAADALGLPTPENSAERMAMSGGEMMTGIGGQAALSRAAAQGVTGAAKGVATALAANPTSQLTGAAGAGLGGQYVAETGGGPVAQFVGSVAGGAAGAITPAVVSKAYHGLSALANALKGQDITTIELNQYVDRVLTDAGIPLSDLPSRARAALLEDMQKALKTDGKLSPAAARRLAEHRIVGTTPTAGTVTLDPVLITQEKNLAKAGANSRSTNLQQLARKQNENIRTLADNLDDMGAPKLDQSDAVEAGTLMQKAMSRVDAPRKARVDRAYEAARAADGRYVDLDVPKFSQLANDALDEGELGLALPEKARRWLNDVSSGELPLNVSVMRQMDKVFSGMAREESRKGNNEAALAIGKVRDALWQTPAASGTGERARMAYDNARRLAAQRFAEIKANPAMKDLLEDGVSPDRFVETYILGRTEKATAKSVLKLATDLRADSVESLNVAKEQILLYLKKAALGNFADDPTNFSAERFKAALDRIGKPKLAAFFRPSEVRHLYTIANVGHYEAVLPKGSAVNVSNTAAMGYGMFERLLDFIGETKYVPGVTGSAQAWSAAIKAKRAMNPLGAALQEMEKPYDAIPAAALALPLAMQNK